MKLGVLSLWKGQRAFNRSGPDGFNGTYSPMTSAISNRAFISSMGAADKGILKPAQTFEKEAKPTRMY
jgi:hypothetical protein